MSGFAASVSEFASSAFFSSSLMIVSVALWIDSRAIRPKIQFPEPENLNPYHAAFSAGFPGFFFTTPKTLGRQ